MADLVQEIEAQIAGAKAATAKQTVGVIREIGDGVARVEGLGDVMLNEMLDFGQGVTGLALNLDETEVGVIILGDYTRLEEGHEVRATGKLLQVPVGKGLLGRVVNTLGEPIDGKGPIASTRAYPVEKLAPGIVRRRPIGQPVQTGIMPIDAMIPIGRGQRELIIGDRSTGKTTICIDTIISQARLNRAAEAAGDTSYRPLYSIYVAIGQKQSTIARIVTVLEEAGAMPYSIILASPASDSATNQYLAPFAGAAIGEWFMDNGMDALIVYDDLSKHAVAYRQVSLVLKRPSGREAYPGDVFYLHSRLLERAARVGEKYGNGSLTALPIIETQAGDVSAYIPTNVISITDGQIFLETDLFYQGIRPAISVGISVSRVGSAAQLKAMKQVAGQLKGDLAQFRELAAFAQFGSELDAATQAKIDRGKRIVEIFKQTQVQPDPVEVQVGVIWAVQNGYVDDVPVERVKEFQASWTDFLTTRKAEPAREDCRREGAERRADGRLEGRRRSVQADLEEIAAMNSPRDLRRRIKSIGGTAQITRAMQMVAASKMRKAQQAAIAAAPFSRLIYRIQRSATTRAPDFEHPLLEVRAVRTRAVILIAADKGLCGALNTNVFRLAAQFPIESTIFITAGRRAAQFVARTRRRLAAEFSYGDSPTFPEARAIASFARDLFLKGDVDEVKIVTTRFVNTLTQEPVVIEYLPVGSNQGPEGRGGGIRGGPGGRYQRGGVRTQRRGAAAAICSATI